MKVKHTTNDTLSVSIIFFLRSLFYDPQSKQPSLGRTLLIAGFAKGLISGFTPELVTVLVGLYIYCFKSKSQPKE